MSNEDKVREAAYFMWENAGRPNGQDEQFWMMAVEQLSNGCKSSSCKSSTAKKSTSTSKKASASSSKTASKTPTCKSSTSSKKSAK